MTTDHDPADNDIPPELAQWAARYLSELSAAASAPQSAEPPSTSVSILTPEAQRLLAAVDAGGVPAFMTHNLRRIARENGLDVAVDTTPNALIDALRRKAHAAADTPPDTPSGTA